MDHTFNKKRYAVRFNRWVVFFLRPPVTGKKKYREPIIDHRQWFPNKKAAEIAIKQWEQMA